MEIVGIIGLIAFAIVLWIMHTSDTKYHYPDYINKKRK